MGHLCREGYLAVDIARQPDGYQTVGVRGEVLPLDRSAVAPVAVGDETAVEAEAAAVVGNHAQPQVLDVECA